MDEQTDPAGDAVCWVGLLCPECGAMPEEGGSQDPGGPCWRCGAVRTADSESDASDPGPD